MGFRDTVKTFRKRLTKPTYISQERSGSKLTDMFNFKSEENPFNNESTWFDLYTNEPFIRGAIDSKTNAIAGMWSLETIKKNPTEKDKKRVDEIEMWLSEPDLTFQTKLITIATKMQLTSLSILEIDRTEELFYILNKADCTLKWNDRKTRLDHLLWEKVEGSSNIGSLFEDKTVRLERHEFVLGSRFEADTNLWQNTVMETLIDIGNLLFHARRYNLKIFEQGGIPSMLFTLDTDTSDKEYNRFVRKMKNTKAGKNLTARGNVKATVIGGFNKDMEFDKMVEHAFQSILTLLNNSPVMMSYLKAKGGNDKQEANAFATSTHSYQGIIETMITSAIHKIFGKLVPGEIEVPDGKGGKMMKQFVGRPKSDFIRTIRFKLRRWVNSREQAAIHKIYLDSTVMTPNEVRRHLGLEPREGGDEVLEMGLQMGNDGNDKPSSDKTEDKKPDEDGTSVD